ncbi:hypothetical protein [Nitrospirillum pindoramense]|uniref:Secretion system X translation initiation factor n=1 Tax=Nitrospirillum amazonense TaxID=28077 RepID=A0A560H5R7_9PROT|nr:hypothetical protein [Nitrospirillum amazonense]TWB41024.1 hypothetical protein FBZ90_10848 [Nitrospirillum amazonense]
MKARHVLMIGGLAVSAGLAVFGDRTPSGAGGAVVEAVTRPATTGPTVATPAAKRKRTPAILALIPREALIGHDGEAAVSHLFEEPTAGRPAATVAEGAGASAGPPPLPFTYLGRKFENAAWEVYLAIGDQTYFVREGSVIEQKYVVNAIKPPVLTFTYLPLKQMQTMTIGGEN